MRIVLRSAIFANFVMFASLGTADERTVVSFTKKVLDTKFRSEGVAVGDFNHDGKMDIAAGSVYYAMPEGTMISIAEKPAEFDPKRYSNTFCNYADDVDGDGWTDLIVVGFPGKETSWFQNPRTPGGPWKKHKCIDITNNESPTYLDVDGDGKRELLCSSGGQYITARPREDPTKPWKIRPISAPVPQWAGRFYHGLGVGDVNRDGRNDVIIPNGWWQSPVDGRVTEWLFHKTDFGPRCSQMHVYDFDGDGDNDVLSSSAHSFGIWWHERTADGWKRHEIDRSFSQTHSLCLADINGDGLQDFVTGKRWWAHGGKDDGGDQPAVMVWFELVRKDGKAAWIPHKFDDDSGVGTQFEVADVNGDGLLDVVTANKKGVFYFEQQRK